MAPVLPAHGPVVSAPALAALLRTCSPADTLAILLDARLELPHLAPMYRVTPATAVAEATAAARVVSEVAHRLQRLRHAYGAWEQFEPGPYFDLTPVQTARLVHVVERVSTVYVVFFVDALLPSFQAVVGAFATPAYAGRHSGRDCRAAEHRRALAAPDRGAHAGAPTAD